jgi:ferredoxin--NADP+ reductase
MRRRTGAERAPLDRHLFSFTTTRDRSLRFSNGHFTMIGLEDGGRKLMRAYSIVSPNYEDHLECLSIKVPGGPLTSKLQHIKPGDRIIVGRKPTGTLLIDCLLEHLPRHEFLGDLVTSKLRYYPTVTREEFVNMGRIAELMESGKLFEDLGVPALDAANDRVMPCGSPAMLRDLKKMLEARGFHEGNTTKRGGFVVERAFAEQ